MRNVNAVVRSNKCSRRADHPFMKSHGNDA